MKIKTIKELKEHLENILADLETYDEDAAVRIVSNTYWLGDKSNFIATREGFIDLSNPTDDDDQDEEDW